MPKETINLSNDEWKRIYYALDLTARVTMQNTDAWELAYGPRGQWLAANAELMKKISGLITE